MKNIFGKKGAPHTVEINADFLTDVKARHWLRRFAVTGGDREKAEVGSFLNKLAFEKGYITKFRTHPSTPVKFEDYFVSGGNRIFMALNSEGDYFYGTLIKIGNSAEYAGYPFFQEVLVEEELSPPNPKTPLEPTPATVPGDKPFTKMVQVFEKEEFYTGRPIKVTIHQEAGADPGTWTNKVLFGAVIKQYETKFVVGAINERGTTEEYIIPLADYVQGIVDVEFLA